MTWHYNSRYEKTDSKYWYPLLPSSMRNARSQAPLVQRKLHHAAYVCPNYMFWFVLAKWAEISWVEYLRETQGQF
jgi:hypothetical protein